MAEVKTPSLQYSGLGDSSSMGFDESTTGQSKSQASRLGSAAKERVTREVDSRKGMVATQLNDIASALEEAANQLEQRGIKGAHRIAGMATQNVRKISEAIEGRSVDELVGMAKQQFRTSPVPVLLGAVALGFFGSRLLRS